MDTVKAQVAELVESHCQAVGQYQEARITVAAWETFSVLTPDEVDRLELALANVYEALHDQAAELARIETELELGE